jgi:hypothetical protein
MTQSCSLSELGHEQKMLDSSVSYGLDGTVP